MASFSRPTNVAKPRTSIGMINYCGRFCPNLSSLLHSLFGLLKKDRAFVRSEDCEQAFLEAKKLMVSDKVLVHCNPKLPVKLISDATNKGIDATLVHEFAEGTEKPICYAFRVLPDAEKNYSIKVTLF